MTIKNTFKVNLKDAMGDESSYIFNLRQCMYLSRTSPLCIRFIFGTHNLVLHFNTFDAINKYLPLFEEYLEGSRKEIEIEDNEYEGAEIEIKD